jgi:hypothetical protein
MMSCLRSQDFVLALVVVLAYAEVPSDEILALPGWDGPLPSRQFSGYLNISVGKATDTQPATGTSVAAQVHYWLVQQCLNTSDKNTTDSPLVLWQQGGPGGSSVGIGYFNELGPFVLDNDSLQRNKSGVPRLVRNKNSWSQYANVLFLEHPAGTGFSYCEPTMNASGTNTTRCKWDDLTQSVAFYDALAEFYHLYPEFVDSGLWLAGESYAGTLLPTLVQQIMQHEDEGQHQVAATNSSSGGGVGVGIGGGSSGDGLSNRSAANASTTSRSFPYLQAIAVGNGCIGTPGANATHRGWCQGPQSHRYHADFFFGHGAVNKQLYTEVLVS